MALMRRLNHNLSQTLARSINARPEPLSPSLRTLATQTRYASTRHAPMRHPRTTRLLLYSSAATATLALSTRAFADYAAPAAVQAPTAAPDIVLYQYEVCPFCNKVRAYLDFHNVAYRVVEVDPLRKTELKGFSEDYRKVPIALIDGQQINGSGDVISHVHALLNGADESLTPAEKRWLTWLDDVFIHLIAPNIYRTPGESLQTFEYIADNAKFTPWQRGTIRYTGAAAMYFVGRKLKKRYDISDERAAIHAAAREWTDAITEGGGKFLDGRDTPGVADLSVYGVLKAIQTFDTFREMRERNAQLGEWFDRTSDAVGETCAVARE